MSNKRYYLIIESSLTIVCILLVLTTSQVFAQPSPDFSWIQKFGVTGLNLGYDLELANDGGYILVGPTQVNGVGNYDFGIVKTDTVGVEEWSQTFGGNQEDVPLAVEKATDGGYVIAGFTSSYGAGLRDIWVVKIDSNGEQDWSQTFGGSSWDEGWAITQSPDGGFLIAGTTFSTGNPDLANGWIIKIDANGNEEWERMYGDVGDDFFFAVENTPDGGYILTGSSSPASNSRDLWLLKTDSLGYEEWSQTYDYNNDNDFGRGVQVTADGGYITATASRNLDTGKWDIWLVKTDAQGNIDWDKSFGGNHNALGRSLQSTSDGGYIISGRVDSNQNLNYDCWFIKTDGEGNEHWNKRFAESFYYEEAQAAFETEDGGYIAAGYSATTNSNSDMLLIKIEPDPYLGIDDNKIGVSPQKHTLQNYPNPFNPTTTISFELPEKSNINLNIYDISGKLVKSLINGEIQGGYHSVVWDGRNDHQQEVSSGVYLYRLEKNGFELTKQCLLLK